LGPSSISNSFWNTDKTGQISSVAVSFGGFDNTLGKTTAEMQQLATFTAWDIANTGGSSAVWRIYEGDTAPLLRSWLAPLTFTADNISKTYNGLNDSVLTNPVYSTLASASLPLIMPTNPYINAINVGSYAPTGFYSSQQGYDIAPLVNGILTITPATLSYTADAVSHLLGTPYPDFTGMVTGFVNGETLETATTGILSFINTFGSNIDGFGLSANYGNYIFTQAPSNAYALTGLVNEPVNDPILFLAPPVFDPVAVANNVASLVAPIKSDNLTITQAFSAGSENYTVPETIPASELSVSDVSGDFADDTSDGKTSSGDSTDKKSTSPDKKNFLFGTASDESKPTIIPVLQMKNSAGQVKRLQMSDNKQFLSLLLEDGSVRIWDFQNGLQRKIVSANKNQTLTDLSAVDDKGEQVSIASKTGLGVHDIVSMVADDKLATNETDIRHFVSSNDGQILLINKGDNGLSLWDNKQNKPLWQSSHERGTVNNLALSGDKRYGAVLSRQLGVYAMDKNNKLKPMTDAVNIIDLSTGKTAKALPNVGEEVVYMRFKDNDTLQLGLASGKLLDWSITTASKKITGGFTETVVSVDNDKDTYSYVTKNGTVRVGNAQDHIQLSIENKENPIKDAKLIEEGKKLLTVLANGDLALWDIPSGKKLLRLFSTQQGWTVMDAFGRFDGSDESIENFSWAANEEEISLNSFSENYYEPGLLTSVLKNQDFLNMDSNRVQGGISLPPKVELQLAEQQTKGDKVAIKLDVYDRGGGINKVNIYHNGKLINTESQTTNQQSQQENNNEHRVLNLNIVPSAGTNTIKVVASNAMDIENSGTEIRFDGKTKAYSSAVRLLTVGINDYKESQLHLNYSVADAELIGDALKNSSKIANSKLLINENATKAKILAELKEISQGTEQDVLVIYFAGHGVALDKEWYFLPYETKLEPNLKKIVAGGISASDLSEIFKNSKIQHILLMVDSCHSGASMDVFSKLQNGQRYFTRQLGRSLGITVITAAAKDQEAAEIKSLGHGLFTYLISQELQKKDSTQPLTAHGIANSIGQTLPAFSQKTIGRSQEPVVYTKGNDFMLSDLLKDKK
jgi:hypothetical protein